MDNKCFILNKYVKCLRVNHFAPYRCFEILEYYGKMEEFKNNSK
jgi:hypothetical protein